MMEFTSHQSISAIKNTIRGKTFTFSRVYEKDIVNKIKKTKIEESCPEHLYPSEVKKRECLPPWIL